MALSVNEARGEVAVTVNGVELVVVAEFEKLSFLSSELKCQSWADLGKRISGYELSAMSGVLETCVVRGDVKAAREAITLKGAVALGGAMTIALVHWLEDEDAEKNAPGAGGGKS